MCEKEQNEYLNEASSDGIVAEEFCMKESCKSVRKKSNGNFIIILAVISISLIMYLKSQENPVRLAPPSPSPTIDYAYAELIKKHSDVAHKKNQNAISHFDTQINLIVKKHENNLSNAAEKAAIKVSECDSCLKIVGYLAWDQVRGGGETEAYLNKEINPFLEPALKEFSTEVNKELEKLHQELQKITVNLAYELATLESNRSIAVSVDVNDMYRSDVQDSLKNLGFGAIGIGLSLGFDAVAIYNSKFAAVVWKKIGSVAATKFGKQVAAVAASPAVAAVDGPIPVGDVIAFLGVVWTALDTYYSRKQFEEEISKSIKNFLSEESYRIHKQSHEKAYSTLKSHQKAQSDIGSLALSNMSKKGGLI